MLPCAATAHRCAAQTPWAIWQRMQKAGGTDDLKAVLSTWTKTKLWIPPKQEQALQQVRGGGGPRGGPRGGQRPQVV